MTKKKKNQLPSGNIRVQVYDYTDVDGKKHYKSFTAPTRQEAKYLAAQWKAGKADNKPAKITLYDAVNLYGLICASVVMFAPDLHLKVTLPEKKRPELYCPSDDDVKKLLTHVEGTELEAAILLAAFSPMRRGEIYALEASDLKEIKYQ